jgi:hypothetical protein
VRKLSRRTTILTVALGILLTASIALAVGTATGEFVIHATTAGEPPTQSITLGVDVDDDGEVVLDRVRPRERITLSVTNPDEERSVRLGVPAADEAGEDTPAVSFEVTAPEGVDCTADDLLVRSLPEWDGVVIEPGGTLTDTIRLDLKPDANPECDGTTLDIKVVISGDVVDDDDVTEEVSGTSEL